MMKSRSLVPKDADEKAEKDFEASISAQLGVSGHYSSDIERLKREIAKN